MTVFDGSRARHGEPGARGPAHAGSGLRQRAVAIGVASLTVGVAVGAALLALGRAPEATAQPRQELAPPRPASAAQAPVPMRPVVVQAGAVSGVPALGTSSPYYRAPAPGTVSLSKPATFTLVEADYWNNATRYFGPTTENKGPAPLGVDQITMVIDKSAKLAPLNFRYTTAEKGVTGALWQISRYPFANDPAHWQAQYVPGLVASGQVADVHVDAQGFHYFVINFARVANRPPGDRPYFEGTATIDAVAGGPTVLGAGTAGAARERIVAPPPGALRQPVAPMLRVRPPGAASAPPATVALPRRAGSADSLPELDHVYYVRVVPMHAGNQAGIPAIPVAVTVKRPHPCPSDVGDLLVRPPSARVVWYMRPNFYSSTDAGGRWYAVTGSQYLPKGVHQNDLVPPMQQAEKAWYEKVIGAFESLLDFFSDAMTDASQMWNALQDQIVNLAAMSLSYTVTGGVYRCDKDPNCTGVLKTTGQVVMAAYGIPPTLPTGPELLDISTDYLVRLGMEELGAGAVYDVYQELPPEVKQQMQAGAEAASSVLMQQQKKAMDDAVLSHYCVDAPAAVNPFDRSTWPGAKANPNPPAKERGVLRNRPDIGATLGAIESKKICPLRIPDPIYNSVHPATVMVYVENRNGATSDRLAAKVADSMGLFVPATVIVPSLKPGESTSIPVVLKEDLSQFLDVNQGPCPTQNAITVSGELPCVVARWREKFFGNGKAADTFSIAFSVKYGPTEVTGLDAQSSGRPLMPQIVLDPGAAGGACIVPAAIRYPAGWTIATTSRSVIPQAWDEFFDTGRGSSANGGVLRAR